MPSRRIRRGTERVAEHLVDREFPRQRRPRICSFRPRTRTATGWDTTLPRTASRTCESRRLHAALAAGRFHHLCAQRRAARRPRRRRQGRSARRAGGVRGRRFPLQYPLARTYRFDIRAGTCGRICRGSRWSPSRRAAGGALAPGNRVFLFGRDALIWETHYRQWEPAERRRGRVRPLGEPGLEIWCSQPVQRTPEALRVRRAGPAAGPLRNGRRRAERLDRRRRSRSSIPSHWTGEPKQLAADRRNAIPKATSACLDPMTGAFVKRFDEKAARLYVADVSGDWLARNWSSSDGNALHIYHNDAPNPRPNQPRLWEHPEYGRSKRTHQLRTARERAWTSPSMKGRTEWHSVPRGKGSTEWHSRLTDKGTRNGDAAGSFAPYTSPNPHRMALIEPRSHSVHKASESAVAVTDRAPAGSDHEHSLSAHSS